MSNTISPVLGCIPCTRCVARRVRGGPAQKPDDVRVCFNMALCRLAQGDYARAEEMLGRVLARVPTAALRTAVSRDLRIFASLLGEDEVIERWLARLAEPATG